MVTLLDVDAAVIDLLRQEFENMGKFSPEGSNSGVGVDPADALGRSANGDRRPSIFYHPVHGEFMDWGFRLSSTFRDAFPEEVDHVVTEFTPYAKLVVERLLQTWVEVDFESYHPQGEGWISGSLTDAEDAKQARETWAKLHDEQPPENYYSSLIEADEEVVRLTMKTHPDRYDSADDFRQQCPERETALFHIDYTEPEVTQLY